MTERDLLFLDHILAAITDIANFTVEGGVDFMAVQRIIDAAPGNADPP